MIARCLRRGFLKALERALEPLPRAQVKKMVAWRISVSDFGMRRQ
jgi:hypothetical protein